MNTIREAAADVQEKVDTTVHTDQEFVAAAHLQHVLDVATA